MTGATSIGTMPAGAASGTEALADLVDAIARKLAVGEPPDLEALRRQYPEHAAEIERLLPTIAILAGVRGPDEPAARIPGAIDETGRVLGDYRLVREIGRGGMGVVYEAEQLSLRRRVALKVLPFAAVLDPRQLQRFRTEAQAAAQLHHGNIVPVFAVGCERGVHYYAMQLIEGRNLERIVEEVRRLAGRPGAGDRRDATEALKPGIDPSAPAAAGSGSASSGLLGGSPASNRGVPYFRAVAELAVQAAEALEYAHSRGIVHRDIKPSNLLVDLSGKLWVADFGLAKIQAERGVTVSADRPGTARYMSPEQVRGEYVDHRADIYSLGITLYELCTLRPAHEGVDRARVLAAVESLEPVQPRAVDPLIPRDLEVIIGKAISKDPRDRYPRAAELAADLRRHLANVPIQARPPSRRVRVAKWARRHRTAVVAAATVLALAFAGLAVSAVAIWRKERETAGALREAEVSLRDAHRAVDRFLLLAADRLAGERGASRVERDLLLEAVGFYRRFLEEDPRSGRLGSLAGIAHSRLGQVYQTIGRSEEAEASYRRAAELLEAVARDDAADRDPRADLAEALNRLAQLLRELGRFDDAAAPLERAIAIRRSMVAFAPGDPDLRARLAGSLREKALLLVRSTGVVKPADPARVEEAIRVLEEGRRELEMALHDSPSRAYFKELLAGYLDALATFLREPRRLEEAEAAYRREAEILEELVSDRPDRLEPRAQLHGCLYNLAGFLQFEAGKPEAAEEVARRAIELGEALCSDFPVVPGHRSVQGALLNNLSMLLRSSGDLAGARVLLETAERHQEAAVRADPSALRPREYLVNHQANLRDVLAELGEREAAAKVDARALETSEALVRDFPGVPQLRDKLANRRVEHARLLAAEGHPADVEASLRQAVDALRSLVADEPNVTDYRDSLASALQELAEQSGASDDRGATGAGAAWSEALALRERLVADEPEAADLRHALGVLLGQVSDRAGAGGDPIEARRLADRAVDEHRRAHELRPASATYLKTLRSACLRVASACVALGDTSCAAARAEDAVALPNVSPEDLVFAAGLVARCAAIAGAQARDASPEDARVSSADAHAKRAVEILGLAVANGFRDAERIAEDESFDGIRGMPELENLVGRMGEP